MKIEEKSLPLVSCIMTTNNRRAFVPQTIEYFCRQDYPNRELIIVDDGADAIEDLVPEDSRIRYLRLEKRLIVGARRNLACRESAGEIIMHWDADDWMAPQRISYQAENLLKEQADICGLDKIYFFDPLTQKAWLYIYPHVSKSWVFGGTLCYKKAFWNNNHFAEIDMGEDNSFVWSNHPKKISVLQDNTFYVALIHAGNTSPKYTTDSRWHPLPVEEIQKLLVPDFPHYTNGSQASRSLLHLSKLL